jgi:hypothetical protein
MAIAYYATKLTDNISLRDDGALVCSGAVIARTGFQSYKARDLPQKQLAAMNLGLNPDDDVSVYRSPDEVFSAATIASFEGRPFTDEHPEKFLGVKDSAETYAIGDHQSGHVQNVRPGDEPLDSGDMPLLADIIITDGEVIRKIEAGKRELSCGYGYDITLQGNQIWQINILGNHVALVRKGRAGPEARINDAAPSQTEIESSTKAVVAEAKTGTDKEKPKMAVTDVLKHIFGLGFQNYAKDADPEKITEAAKAFAAMGKDAEDPDTEKEAKLKAEKEKAEKDKEDKDKAAKDKEDKEKAESEKAAADKKAKDCEEAEAKAKDAAKGSGKDKRSRFGKLFDKAMDEMGVKAGEEEGEATDSDIEELRDLLEEYFDEEADEPQHADDKKAKGKDAVIIEPFTANDSAAAANDAVEVLKRLRPLIAKEGSQALKNAFTTEAALVNGRTRTRGTGKDNYSRAHSAAAQRSGRAQDNHSQDDQSKALNDMYAKLHGKNAQEVK